MRGRRVALMLVPAMLVVGLAGCGSDDGDIQSDDTATPTTVTETPSATAAPSSGGDPAPNLESEAFTVDYGCGYGFWTGNDDQTLALLLEFTDFDAAASGNVPPVGNVPSVIWSGSVRTGVDLFANWCDDVVEEGEPEPVVDSEWTVVDASLSLDGEPPVQTCGELSVVVSDIVLEDGDGAQVALDGSIEITNEAWGCFAG